VGVDGVVGFGAAVAQSRHRTWRGRHDHVDVCQGKVRLGMGEQGKQGKLKQLRIGETMEDQ